MKMSRYKSCDSATVLSMSLGKDNETGMNGLEIILLTLAYCANKLNIMKLTIVFKVKVCSIPHS
jgi:hypothetical protein